MFVRSISLRKLIKILFSPANRRVSGIRKDIREDMKRSQDATAGGSDFLRVLLSKNVSGPHLTDPSGGRKAKAGGYGEERPSLGRTLTGEVLHFKSIRSGIKFLKLNVFQFFSFSKHRAEQPSGLNFLRTEVVCRP